MHSAASRIMTPGDDNKLVEISQRSSVIKTLSDLVQKQIRIFVPGKVLPSVREVVDG